ncbi:MAG: mechanosensitive ion channel [Planctomycetota bacterium]|nr:mechanosensitive ion channel [Planctomycetota bacterium]
MSHSSSFLVRLSGLLVALLLSATPAFGLQSGGPSEGPPTLADLRIGLDELIEAGQAEGEEAQLVTAAIVDLEAAEALRVREGEFQRMVEEAPGLLTALAEELAEAPEALKVAADPNLDLKALESLLLQAEADRTSAQAKLETVSAEFVFRSKRLELIPTEVAALRDQVSEVETTLRALPADDALLAPRQARLRAQLERLHAEEQLLSRERQAYEVRRDLLPMRRDRAQRQLQKTEATVATLRQLVSGRRAFEAELGLRDAEATRAALTEQHPMLGEVAARNEVLAQMRSGPTGTLAEADRARATLTGLEAGVGDVEKRLIATQKKVAAGGLSRGIGSMLRSEYEALATPRSLRADSARRRDRLSQAQLQLLELEEEREQTGDPTIRLQAILAALEAEDGTRPSAEVEGIARDLVVTHRALLDDLTEDLGKLVASLLESERLHAELLAETMAYRTFIEERILWVPSLSGGVVPSPGDAVEGLAWLVSPTGWVGTMDKAHRSITEGPGKTAIWLLALLGLLGARRPLRRSLRERSELVRSYRKDSYRHTILGLGETIALTLPVPLCLYMLGWLLTTSSAPTDVGHAVGEALNTVAVAYLALGLLRRICLSTGLSVAHFRWPQRSVQALRKELGWLLPAVVGFEFLVSVYNSHGVAAWNDALGRPALWCLMLSLWLFVHRNLGPSRGLLVESMQRNQGLLQRFHSLWYGLLLTVLLGLLGLSVLGYHYTALELGSRVRSTLGFVLLLVLVNALLLRWLFIARRRLAVQQARARALAKAQAQAGQDEAGASIAAAASIEEDATDIPAVDAQTRQLIRTGVVVSTLLGFFLIWAGAFPALRVFERVQLWPKVMLLEDTASAALRAEGVVSEPREPGPAATGEIASATLPGPLTAVVAESNTISAITLADVFLSLVIFLLIGVAAKNAPGVLEIALLRRLPLDTGSRHAVTTLFRYLILMIGIPAGFGAIGIGWSQVQWLAAALTFGLAFGLQEIFANFVSGVIILIERPVRVGDIVTVGNFEGRITQLRMRSTTILDWDRREFLIPNREFITGSVVNWTLSDPVIREIIKVGIAYGSDTKRATELLMESAAAEPLVLADPGPSVVFRSFGDSSLDFELRVFMGNREHLPELVTRMNMAIDQAFRKAGIEIAFPQRDLHVRSLPPKSAGAGPDVLADA